MKSIELIRGILRLLYLQGEISFNEYVELEKKYVDMLWKEYIDMQGEKMEEKINE